MCQDYSRSSLVDLPHWWSRWRSLFWECHYIYTLMLNLCQTAHTRQAHNNRSEYHGKYSLFTSLLPTLWRLIYQSKCGSTDSLMRPRPKALSFVCLLYTDTIHMFANNNVSLLPAPTQTYALDAEAYLVTAVHPAISNQVSTTTIQLLRR